MSLKNLDILCGYYGRGKDILKRFVLPCLGESVAYDRITSYYNFSSLLAIAEGLQTLYESDGAVRLVLGVHSIPHEILEAAARRDYLRTQVDLIRAEIAEGASIADELQKRSLATLAWMMEDGLLQIRAAALEGEGIFHPKTLIFVDSDGDRAVAVGSSNETGSGWGNNFEQLMVACSWHNGDMVTLQEEFFRSLWENTCEYAVTGDITAELATTILEALGPEHSNPKNVFASPDPAEGIIATAAKMPAYFFVSGAIPALYQHQERAVIDALSRWPVRVLFGDEVGLGKTFEAAATLTYLVRFCGVKRVLILTPKAVLSQWQEELFENFGLEAWLFDSTSKAYLSPTGREIKVGNSNPIGSKSPDLMLMSAQYARGSKRQKSVFDRSGAVLPELLVLDEAHSARVSKSLSGATKTTKIYSMIEGVADRIPHIIFATATPMQKEPSEYHSMLKLLGLPKTWAKASNYSKSLALTVSTEPPSTSDAYLAGKLIRSTCATMHPSLQALSKEERSCLEGLLDLPAECDRAVVANYVAGHWDYLQPVFVKLHPAHLLTVRNTRRSLSEMGYRFPERVLHAEPIADSADIQLFYMSVDDYITNRYFSVEGALYPDRSLNTGFVRISYQQRLASSLYSCRESLRRRLAKMQEFKSALARAGKSQSAVFGEMSDFDSIDEDDAFADSEAFGDDYDKKIEGVDMDELERAIALESTNISSLIAHAESLLASCRDLKVSRSIQLALEHLERGDKVLVFSRYTDTIDALVNAFEERDRSSHSYGVYVGDRSEKHVGGRCHPATKSEIRTGLESGEVPIMFCSDAASEGLNLQAARVLINVDVPWTPARLEQRIGRVARLGQKAESVEIYNVWYPNSVESRMYSRIQERHQATNIAIGEYPDVVARKIRDAALGEATDDDGLQELQELRNSTQSKALSELWSLHDNTKTTSRLLRDMLIDLCDENFECVGVQGGVKRYVIPGEGIVNLSAEEGRPESISLASSPWKHMDFDLQSFCILNDREGNPSAFASESDKSRWLDHEALVELLSGQPVSFSLISSAQPVMLPDNGVLDMTFAMSQDAPKRPSFWPPLLC